ncbi:uncharacterized protein LOC126986933 [Eriocheir sinensis]|uniref:uncharacterized protein LOC126986933 n=1 Tax=Eriocheir sinensis TaxID=95602 RepID=UPI0021C7D2B6|nr:uncharacterized protein LOC126986933 [Eriocheir sinensis]
MGKCRLEQLCVCVWHTVCVCVIHLRSAAASVCVCTYLYLYPYDRLVSRHKRRMKRSRPSRRTVKCNECKKSMSYEFWKNTHCTTVHPTIRNPRYTEIDTHNIEKFFSAKQRKVGSTSDEPEGPILEVPSQSGEVVAAALPSISTDVDSSLPQPASTQSTTSVSAPPSTAVPSESKVTDEPLPLPSPVSSSQTTLGDVLPVLPRSPASPTKITEVPSPPQSPLPVRPAPFLATASDVPPASPTTSATVSPSKATNVILPLLSQAVAPSSLSGPGTKTSSTPTHVLSAAQDTASTVNTTTGDYQKSSVVPLAPTVVEFHEESTSTLLKKSDKQQGDQALSVSDPKLVSDDEWIKCVGQLEVITNQSKNLINTVKSDCVIGNVEEFLTSVVSSSKEIKFLCGKLELKSQNLLSQVLEEAANREDYLTDVLQSDDQVPQDPGSRPVVLTDKQRMYLVKLGPYQPKLSSFPKNEAMKKVKDTCQDGMQREQAHGSPVSLSWVVLYTWGVHTGVSQEGTLRGWAVRATVLALCVYAVILTVAYTSTLTASLTVAKKQTVVNTIRPRPPSGSHHVTRGYLNAGRIQHLTTVPRPSYPSPAPASHSNAAPTAVLSLPLYLAPPSPATRSYGFPAGAFYSRGIDTTVGVSCSCTPAAVALDARQHLFSPRRHRVSDDDAAQGVASLRDPTSDSLTHQLKALITKLRTEVSTLREDINAPAGTQPSPVVEWTFDVATVSHPILGADFLTHYNILIDLKNRKLLDPLTSVSTRTRPAAGDSTHTSTINAGVG